MTETLYRPITIPADTLARIWREQQRFIVYRGELEIQRGDRLRFDTLARQFGHGVDLTSDERSIRSDERPILVLASFVTAQGQPSGQLVVGFETIEHWTDDQLHGLDASGWEGRSGLMVGKVARTRPHPQQDEIDRLAKLIRENSIKNAPLKMQERAWDLKKQLHAIAPGHTLLKGWEAKK